MPNNNTTLNITNIHGFTSRNKFRKESATHGESPDDDDDDDDGGDGDKEDGGGGGGSKKKFLIIAGILCVIIIIVCVVVACCCMSQKKDGMLGGMKEGHPKGKEARGRKRKSKRRDR